MSFRRLPFQFSSTDPVQRQAELEKRFGLSGSNMYVDVANPLIMEGGNKDPNMPVNSPRLQHRVPIFVEGRDQPVKSSVDSVVSSLDGKKPNVRVIPIQIEGAEVKQSARHRTLSGPAGQAKGKDGESMPQKEDSSPLKRSMQDLSESSKMRATARPVIYNVPIKIESKSEPVKNDGSDKVQCNSFKKEHAKVNGGTISEQPCKEDTSEKENDAIETSLKKIFDILEELKLYDTEVQKYTGTVKDKQYRYLDEMLTRCMLRLDDVDTMGNEKIRSSRKNAVKKVQASIDLLETKVSLDNETVTGGKNEELDNAVVKEMNGEDSDMKDITFESTDIKNSQDMAPDMEISKEGESDVLSITPFGNLASGKKALSEEKDEREMVQAMTDECKADAESTGEITEVNIDQRIPNTYEVADVEMKEAENLSSSHNAGFERTNKCEVEMAEGKSSQSEIQNKNLCTSTDVIPIDQSQIAQNENKVTDVEMEDIQGVQKDYSNALPDSSSMSLKEVSTDYQTNLSIVPEEFKNTSDCDHVTGIVKSKLETPENALIAEANEDSSLKD